MSAHALAILFLPGFVGKLLRNDRIATLHNLMHKLSMEAFAMSGQLALPRSEPVSGSLVPLAVTPTQAAFFHPSFLVIVLWIIGTTLPIQLALYAIQSTPTALKA